MSKSSIPDDLETVVINHSNHNKLDDELRNAQKFLSTRYSSDKVLPYEAAKGILRDKANKDYRWIVVKQKGNIVALAVSDIWNVPKSTSKDKLISDGKNQYTALFYATSAGKKYEPVLEAIINIQVILHADLTSSHYRKRNIGILTDDTRHKRVLRRVVKEMGGLVNTYGGSLGKTGVPTLKDTKDYSEIFKTNNYAELVAIPFCKWTKSLAARAVALYLDEAYNSKEPNEKGYKPLTKAEYFKEFEARLNKQAGRFVEFAPIR